MNAPNEIKESIGGATRYQFRNGSDSPSIMGASPWGSWQSVKDAIMGVSTFKGNIATRHGEDYEAEALAAALKEYSVSGQSQVRLIEGEYAATLDFLSDDGETIIEVKCPYQGKNSKIWKSVMDFADPSYYIWQAHHQMLVAPNAKVHVLFVYDASTKSYCYCETTRNQSAINDLKAKWDDFYAWMATDQPDPNDGWVQASQTWCLKAAQYADITKQLKSMEEQQASLKKDLLDMAEGDRVKGSGLTLVKSIRQGNVDYKKIPELKGLDLDQYRGKSTEVWTLK